MPLCHIVGVDNGGKTFTVCHAFLDQKDAANYLKIARDLKALYGEGLCPSVVVTDRELALIEAVEHHFAPIRTKHILCIWHINMNIAKNYKDKLAIEER